jgi:galactokinase
MTSGVGGIPRFTDKRFNGYLANINPSKFLREYESELPELITGGEFLRRFGMHVDPATPVLPEHNYRVRANTRYAVLENNRVTLFSQLLRGCMQNVPSDSTSQQLQSEVYVQLGELMYQSHDSYTECGLGSEATTLIVDLVRSIGSEKGLFGAKITGGGAGGTVAILGLKSAESSFQEVVRSYAKERGLSQPPYVFVGTSFGADAFGIKELYL